MVVRDLFKSWTFVIRLQKRIDYVINQGDSILTCYNLWIYLLKDKSLTLIRAIVLHGSMMEVREIFFLHPVCLCLQFPGKKSLEEEKKFGVK